MEDSSVIYNHKKLQNWSDSVEGGLSINIAKSHWIFLRADVGSKTINVKRYHRDYNLVNNKQAAH